MRRRRRRLEAGDDRLPERDRRYAEVPPAELPRAESLADTVRRVLPFWHERIAPTLAAGRVALVVAHGNSLRGLVKYLDGISDEVIPDLEIPTGAPLLYELDDKLRPLRHRYLDGRPG